MPTNLVRQLGSLASSGAGDSNFVLQPDPNWANIIPLNSEGRLDSSLLWGSSVGGGSITSIMSRDSGLGINLADLQLGPSGGSRYKLESKPQKIKECPIDGFSEFSTFGYSFQQFTNPIILQLNQICSLVGAVVKDHLEEADWTKKPRYKVWFNKYASILEPILIGKIENAYFVKTNVLNKLTFIRNLRTYNHFRKHSIYREIGRAHV